MSDLELLKSKKETAIKSVKGVSWKSAAMRTSPVLISALCPRDELPFDNIKSKALVLIMREKMLN